MLDFRREILGEGIDFGLVSIYSRKLRLWDWVRMPRESPSIKKEVRKWTNTNIKGGATGSDL